MRSLVWRYVSAMHRRMEEDAVTEDDINEVKGEISAMRYEMLEIFEKNGMDVSSADRKEKSECNSKLNIFYSLLLKLKISFFHFSFSLSFSLFKCSMNIIIAVLAKRMKVWERRLMKDFQVAPISNEEPENENLDQIPENETSLSKFRRVARQVATQSSSYKWGQVRSNDN